MPCHAMPSTSTLNQEKETLKKSNSSTPHNLNVYKPTFIINNSFESEEKMPQETRKMSDILQQNLKQAIKASY